VLFPSEAEILEREVTTATRVAELICDRGRARVDDRGRARVDRPEDIRGGTERELHRPEY